MVSASRPPHFTGPASDEPTGGLRPGRSLGCLGKARRVSWTRTVLLPHQHVRGLLSLSEMPLPGQLPLVLQVSNQASLPPGNSLAIQTVLGTGFFRVSLYGLLWSHPFTAGVSPASHVCPSYALYHVISYSSVCLALLEDGELLENRGCLLTIPSIRNTVGLW